MAEKLYFDFQILLDFIGLILGVTIGIILIVMGLRKFRATFFLGLFLVFYALELAVWISINSKISANYPELFLLPFNFSWILFPLFYIYTQQVSVFSETKIKYWLLYPGIISILAQVVIFWLPVETKKNIEESTWHTVFFWILGNYYSWGVGIWNLRLLYKHKIEVLNTYSYVSFKELQWARYFLIYLLTTSIFGHIIAYVFPTAFTDNTIFSVMDLIAIIWVAYFGLTQREVKSLLSKNWDIENDKQSSSLKAISPEAPEVNIEKLKELMITIDEFMIRSESFINPEFTIMDLANGIKKHPKLVSEAINSVKNQNFNSYINQYRINKAKTLLKTDLKIDLSIEGIGSEVGFKSKSVFYAAFKKFTGTTPNRYKENLTV